MTAGRRKERVCRSGGCNDGQTSDDAFGGRPSAVVGRLSSLIFVRPVPFVHPCDAKQTSFVAEPVQ